MTDSLIAHSPELLDAEWITAALRSVGHDVTVVAVEISPVGTGQMGESYRMVLTFEGDSGSVPASLIAKLPSPNKDMRPMVAGAYRSELTFYRDLAPRLPVRVPDTFFMAASEDHADFVLLMEDLAPRRQGDQILGCSPTAVRHAVVNLAGLHAGSWCDESLYDLSNFERRSPEAAAMMADSFVGAVDIFVERYDGRLAAGDAELLRKIAPALDPWSLGRPERFALIHGDYRLDNLLFPADDGSDVVAVDWQTLDLGLPGRDVAYLLQTSLDAEARRQNERELIAAYHQALVTHGVTGYDVELAFDDYAYGALQGPLITVFGAAYGSRTDRGDDMFVAMITRSLAAVRDLGTLELVG